jgi:hypothetical protein
MRAARNAVSPTISNNSNPAGDSVDRPSFAFPHRFIGNIFKRNSTNDNNVVRESVMERPSMMNNDNNESNTNNKTNPNNNNNSSSQSKRTPVFVKKIKVFMYSYGAPRVGNYGFKQFYDKIVPNAFRVVIDGDLVTGLPPSGYDHVGTEILVDSLGAGSVIIDPSFVEKWLRTHLKSSVTVHSLVYYQKGLLGLKLSAQYMREYAEEISAEHPLDPLRLAVRLRDAHKIEKLVEAEQENPSAENRSNNPAIPTTTMSISERYPRKQDILIDSNDSNNIELQEFATNGSREEKKTLDASLSINIVSDNPQLDPVFSPSVSGTDPSSVFNVLHETPANQPTAVPVPAENKIDLAHYEHDVRNMNELMSQINTFKKTGSIEEWFKKNTIQRFQRKKGAHDDSNIAENTASSSGVIVGSHSKRVIAVENKDPRNEPIEEVNSIATVVNDSADSPV